MPVIDGGRANPHTTHDMAGIAALNPVNTIKLAEDVTSFDKALRAFDRIGWAIHKGRLGEGRKRPIPGTFRSDYQIASNVYLRHMPRIDMIGEPGYMAIVLYDTEIVRYYPGGRFSVDNGGFNTPTTSSRITQFTPNGWYAWHEAKQIAMHKYSGEERISIHPATHDQRIKP